jgi:hypothetical protein
MWAVRTKARESCSSTSDGDVVARQAREGGRESPEGEREREGRTVPVVLQR